MVADVSDIDSAAGKRDSNRRNLWKSRREQERAEPRWIVERGGETTKVQCFHAPLPGGLVGRQPDTADSDRITTSFEILYTAEGGRHDSPLPPPRFGSGELANRSRLRGRYRAKGASNAIERDTGGEDPWIAAGERAGKIRAAREGGVEGVGI